MLDPIRYRGTTHNLRERVVARVSKQHLTSDENRKDTFLVISGSGDAVPSSNTNGYAGVITDDIGFNRVDSNTSAPIINTQSEITSVSEDSILAINPSGHIFVLYRPESKNNSIFATGRCNSDCIMCSQPPVTDEPNDMLEEHLRVIRLIRTPPETLGITGGEPTLLEDDLVTLLGLIKDRMPNTDIHMLTNGRMYAYREFAKNIANVGLQNFLSAIPLYANNAADHDYIVQSKGAFDQTISGLYNAAENGLDVEIRIVLHKQTIDHLEELSEFIYRNLPFVQHIALMGLENMGYVKSNWELLWVDPADYTEKLERAVKYMFYRNMNVSIYNLQLCVLPEKLWGFSRQSISDYKNIFIDECKHCTVQEKCGGLFKSSEARHSRAIHSL